VKKRFVISGMVYEVLNLLPELMPAAWDATHWTRAWKKLRIFSENDGGGGGGPRSQEWRNPGNGKNEIIAIQERT